MQLPAQLIQRLLQTDGKFARQLGTVTALEGGFQATLGTIPFRNLGDDLRPIILSNESLSDQITSTNVPNRPPDILPFEKHIEEDLALRVEVISPSCVRLRLGPPTQLEQPRDFTMLQPDSVASAPLSSLPVIEEKAETVVITLEGLRFRLQHDPFAFSITQQDSRYSWSTATDDRDVHGLLCTPPPGIATTSAEEKPEAYWTWSLAPDEHLYGLGERFNGFDQRGRSLTLWTQDAWGTTTDAAYKNIPFLLSSEHYGLFFHTPTAVQVRLGTTSGRSARVQVSEEVLDLYVIFGETPKSILAGYTMLTGRATMIPRWAFGVWLSRCRYQNRAEVEEVARRLREEEIPCDVLHLDPAWLERPNLSCDFVPSDENFPDLPEMIRQLDQQGFKISLWELPYVSSHARRFQEAKDAGYFLKGADGEPISGDFGSPPADGNIRAILDFTNPAARSWWQDLHRPLLQAGVACFKTDFGEAVPREAIAYNGMDGATLHNLYPLLYNEAVHEVILEENSQPGMIWGRSGWAGIQRHPAQWGGDPKTDVWSMRTTLRGGLSYALSAPGIWSHDIGGFYGPSPSPELYMRWTQFGMLSPLTRAHGTTPREPWEFGAEALENFKRYARLRIRLNPYLYSLGWQTHKEGLPMLRPLLLEFPDDPGTALIDDSYMLGDSLLVAPIFSEDREPVARHLYLPQGEWIDFWTDERLTGGRYITRQAPLDTIPLYVKAGSILPLGPELQFIGSSVPSDITLEVYPGTGTTTSIVWDHQGNATILELSQITDQQWQLAIDGQRPCNWTIRWHINGSISETRLVYSASATVSPE
ncbi:alpha-xylosidase [Dictyobacter sp. S3.2.2.5]|uniref:Alpha-xylosidase n=1 Tax=Dictyobacter halimunensis TaxID=3026934 RepID=A0ABQ6FJY9_9CHLR|nr:alpha-xylosidase [Dictyobacter sp. S3.2.2.5]